MSASHTPGPWKLNGRIVQTEEKSGFCVAEVFGGFGKPLEKNGMLIAASPDLLEALQDFSDYVRTEQSATDGAVHYSNTQIHRLVFKARAAIAKATGAAS